MPIYENVKKACAEKGVTVFDLEKKLNFPRSSINKWSKNIPSVSKVKAVADFLEKPIEYFLTEHENEPGTSKED